MLGSGSSSSTLVAEATRVRKRRSLAISVASSMMSTPKRLSVMILFLTQYWSEGCSALAFLRSSRRPRSLTNSILPTTAE